MGCTAYFLIIAHRRTCLTVEGYGVTDVQHFLLKYFANNSAVLPVHGNHLTYQICLISPLPVYPALSHCYIESMGTIHFGEINVKHVLGFFCQINRGRNSAHSQYDLSSSSIGFLMSYKWKWNRKCRHSNLNSLLVLYLIYFSLL